MPYAGTMKLSARDWFRRESQAVTVEPRTPQERFPLHEHEFGEIVIVMSGNGWHLLNDEPQLITCGEVFYIRPEDHHSFEQVNDLYLTNVIYRPSDRLLRPERIKELLEPGESGGRRRWQVTEDALRELRALLDALARETRSDDPLADVMAESLFMQLAVALCRHRFAIDGDQIPPAAQLGHLLAFLRHRCGEDVDLDEVAHRYGYSPRTFCRVFRDATGTTPHSYLVSLRLGRAMHALRATGDSITDIAFASGFHDSNYFSSCFSKMTGVSPTEYRRQARGPGIPGPGGGTP
ncbi:MAG TPA: helix-turn-helix domain-containing protein [Anaeromyxobacter sp.]|nr:helix-turn-helix domain-containing protein [Anaeromyxobacter sp.]